MKMPVFLFLMSLSLGVKAQSLEEKIANKACNCFVSPGVDDRARFMEIFVQNCLNSTVMTFDKEIAQVIDTTRDGYSAGYDYGFQKAPEIMGLMILNCDRFYLFFDSLRDSGRKSIEISSVQRELETLSEKIKQGEALMMNYFSRGIAHFQLEKYKLANQDFNEAIRLQPEFGGSYMFRGWIKEIVGDYESAKEDYKKCFELTQQQSVLLFVALAEKKQRIAIKGKKH